MDPFEVFPEMTSWLSSGHFLSYDDDTYIVVMITCHYEMTFAGGLVFPRTFSVCVERDEDYVEEYQYSGSTGLIGVVLRQQERGWWTELNFDSDTTTLRSFDPPRWEPASSMYWGNIRNVGHPLIPLFS